MDDKPVVACNLIEGTGVFPVGALAYVVYPNLSNAAERVCIRGRSRSGRWVDKWENGKRLGSFRAKVLPPESPRYALMASAPSWDEDTALALNRATEKLREE